MTTNDRHIEAARRLIDRALYALAVGEADGECILHLAAQNGVLHIPRATYSGHGWEKVLPEPSGILWKQLDGVATTQALANRLLARLRVPGFWGRAEIHLFGRQARLQKPKAELIEDLAFAS